MAFLIYNDAMELKYNNSMAIPNLTPIPPPDTDWKFLIEWVSGWIAGCSTLIYLIRAYFKDKRDEADRIASIKKVETEEFIQKVAVACVKATFDNYRTTIDGMLDAINSKIETLFTYREEDRKESTSQYRELIKEIRK